MSIRDAVRISMSIPLYYKPVLIDDSGLMYSKTVQNKIIHLMVDGGVLLNYPIHMFDSTKYSATFDSINTFYSNPETLGILLERSDQIKHSSQNSGVAPVDIKNETVLFSTLFYSC